MQPQYYNFFDSYRQIFLPAEGCTFEPQRDLEVSVWNVVIDKI